MLEPINPTLCVLETMQKSVYSHQMVPALSLNGDSSPTPSVLHIASKIAHLPWLLQSCE